MDEYINKAKSYSRNRKRNNTMWLFGMQIYRKIIAIAISICALIGVLSGCTSVRTESTVDTVYAEECQKPPLVVVAKDVSVGASIHLLCDTETGIEYWFIKNGYGAGLTPRLTADGSAYTDIQTTTETKEW